MLLISCSTAKTNFKRSYKYDNLHTVEIAPGKFFRTFTRDGRQYQDTLLGDQIISRETYSGDLLLYKYPITQADVSPVNIRFKSGKNYLQVGKTDTITILNKVPLVNQALYTKGAAFTRLSSFRIAITVNNYNVKEVGLFLIAMRGNEEIKDHTQFKDSIFIPVQH